MNNQQQETRKKRRQIVKSVLIGFSVLALIYFAFANLYMWSLGITLSEFMRIQKESATLIGLIVGGSVLHIAHFIIREL